MQWDIKIFWYERTINTFPQRKSLRFFTYQSNSKCGWGFTIQIISTAVLDHLKTIENLVDVFIVSIVYGNSKLKPLNDFLADFINEVKILKNDGLVVTSNKTITISIKCFVCDAPARAFLKCVVNHIGYSSCEMCEIKGEWNGRVTFNELLTLSRTSAYMRNLMTLVIHYIKKL